MLVDVEALQARELAYQTFFPAAPGALRPLMHLNLNITNALLPPPLRTMYNLEWSSSQQRMFEMSARATRLLVPRMPTRLRELPLTRRLMRGEWRDPVEKTRKQVSA